MRDRVDLGEAVRVGGVADETLSGKFPERQVAGKFEVTELGSRLDVDTGPFMDTAAVMTCLDLFITSDTAVAHLAGSLGVPVWMALSTTPDWRWLSVREDNPWYPTMRIFRQQKFMEWVPVFDRIAVELRKTGPIHGSDPIRGGRDGAGRADRQDHDPGDQGRANGRPGEGPQRADRARHPVQGSGPDHTAVRCARVAHGRAALC